MNNFKERFDILEEERKNLKQNSQELEKKLDEKRKENKDLDKKIEECRIELSMLKSKRNIIVDKNVEKIRNTFTIISLLIIVLTVVASLKLGDIIIPTGIIKQIFGVVLMASIGGSIDMIIVAALKIVSDKIIEKIRNKNGRKKDCVKLSNKISEYEKVETQYLTKRDEIQKEYNAILDKVREQKNLISLNASEIEKLREEIVNSVIGVSSVVNQQTPAEEITKAPKRVKTINTIESNNN